MTTWNDHLNAPTREQMDFVETLRSRLHISHTELDHICEERFGVGLSGVSKPQCSALIEQMLAWKRAPAQLQRERGQLDMFGNAS